MRRLMCLQIGGAFLLLLLWSSYSYAQLPHFWTYTPPQFQILTPPTPQPPQFQILNPPTPQPSQFQILNPPTPPSIQHFWTPPSPRPSMPHIWGH